MKVPETCPLFRAAAKHLNCICQVEFLEGKGKQEGKEWPVLGWGLNSEGISRCNSPHTGNKHSHLLWSMHSAAVKDPQAQRTSSTAGSPKTERSISINTTEPTDGRSCAI